MLRKLYIEPTTKCNLNCKMCFRHTWFDEPMCDLSLEEYKAISPVFDDSVYAAINVNECAQARKVVGGPAKEATTMAIANNKAYFETI